ncbi:hypothetical protein MASR2M15_02530 [Anaerolineales bacterium]
MEIEQPKEYLRIEKWTRILHQEDAYMRCVAADQLGEIGDSTSVPHLIEEMLKGGVDVAIACVRALGQIGSKEAVPALIHLLGSTEDGELQTALLKSLGLLEDARAVPTIIQVVRVYRQARALYPLQAVGLAHESVTYTTAINALKRIGTPEALAAADSWATV